MRGESFQRVVIAFQFFVVEHSMYVAMTGPAQHGDALFHIAALKGALGALFAMSRARNQVMARELRHQPAT